MNPIDVVTGIGSVGVPSVLAYVAVQLYKTFTDRRGQPSGRQVDMASLNVRLDAENQRLLARVDKLQLRVDALQTQIDDEREAHRTELVELRQQLDTMTAEHRRQMDAMSERLAAAEDRYRRDVH